jgi:hypothetical protein
MSGEIWGHASNRFPSRKERVQCVLPEGLQGPNRPKLDRIVNSFATHLPSIVPPREFQRPNGRIIAIVGISQTEIHAEGVAYSR